MRRMPSIRTGTPVSSRTSRTAAVDERLARLDAAAGIDHVEPYFAPASAGSGGHGARRPVAKYQVGIGARLMGAL